MIKGDMADMMIKEIFGKVKIYRLLTRVLFRKAVKKSVKRIHIFTKHLICVSLGERRGNRNG